MTKFLLDLVGLCNYGPRVTNGECEILLYLDCRVMNLPNVSLTKQNHG